MAQDPFAEFVVEDDPFAAYADEPRMMASHESAPPPKPRQLGDNMAGELWREGPNQLPRPTGGEVLSNLPGAAAEVALSQAAGGIVGKGLKLAARGMYRAGALPLLASWSKYGDLVSKGLDDAVPVTKAGGTKAANLKMAAQAKKAGAVTAADAKASFRTQGIADDALSRVAGKSDELRRAGLGDPSKAHQLRVGRLVKENPVGMKPSELETIKGTVDDTLGPAYKKLRMKEALSPTEQMNMAVSHSAGDAMGTVVPNYKGLNKDVMDAEGLRRMIMRRLQGNQGLENALTMAVGPAAIPARLAMIPGVASHAGIAAHKSAPYLDQATRAALMALLASEQNE